MRHVAPGITAILFFATAWFATIYVFETYQYGQIAPALDWPLWTVQIVMPYAFISIGLRNLIYAIDPDLTPKSSGIM